MSWQSRWKKVINRRGEGKSKKEREETIIGEEKGLHQEDRLH